MDFDRNIEGFPTMVHRDIYMTALHLKPPEVTLAEIEKNDPELAKSGRELHAFLTELLADMYKDPCPYGMNPGEYEKFMYGRRYNGVKRKQPTKALAFYKKSGAELSSYLGLLKEIALHCAIKDGCCILSAGDFEKIKKQKRAIPFETVIKMLEKKVCDYM